MTYVVKTICSAEDEWKEVYATNSIVDAYAHMQKLKATNEHLVVDIENTETGEDYEDILIKARQRRMDALFNYDYEYEEWLNETYCASYFIDALRCGRKASDILAEIENQWAIACQFILDGEDDEDILREYAY